MLDSVQEKPLLNEQPINELQQWEQTLLSRFLQMVQTDDGDFAVIDQLSKACSDRDSFQMMVDRLSQYPQGKIAFEKCLSLGAIDLEQLKTLPDNTLGHIYAEHMLQNQLKPLVAPPAENAFQFLGTHLTETHDIWHVITGSKTDILGEIQLEAFYVAQLEVSRFWLALLAKNLLKSVLYDIESATGYMDVLTRGWLMGKKAKPLFGTDWSSLWATPIEEIRASFNIDVEL